MKIHEQETTSITRWGVVALALLCGVVGALQVGKVPPSLPLLRDELGLSLTTAGWVASIFNLCGAVFGIGVALAGERLGPARLATRALLALFLGGVIGALAPSAAWLLAARFIEGIGFVGAVVAASALIVAATDDRARHTAFGFWGAYLPTGSALAMLAAPAMLDWGGWRSLWWINVGAVVLTWLLLRWGLHPRRWHDRVPERRRTWPEIRSTLALPGPWLYAVAFVTYGIQYFAVATWLPTFLIEQQGLTLAAAAGATAVVVIANVVGNLISGALMRRGWKRWVLLMIAYPGMAGFAWMLFAEASPDELRIPAAIAFCLVGGLLPAAALSGAPSHARTPDEVVVCGGVVVQGANTGSLLGAPLVALAVGWLGGWQHAWTVMAALGGLGILTALMLAKIEGGLRR